MDARASEKVFVLLAEILKTLAEIRDELARQRTDRDVANRSRAQSR